MSIDVKINIDINVDVYGSDISEGKIVLHSKLPITRCDCKFLTKYENR